MEPSLIFLNYFVDPKRRNLHYRDLLTHLDPTKYVITDALSAGDEPRVRVIVNKTRELSANTLKAFPHLKGICLNTTDRWMLTFDEDNTDIAFQTVDTDRGTDVAEIALLLMLTGLKTLNGRSRWHAFRSPTRFYRQLAAPIASETVGAHNWTGTSTLTAYRKKVGIIGYGLIGHQIQRRLKAFGADVFYNHSTRFSALIEKRLDIQFLDREQLFQDCDIIFVQLPLTTATEDLITNKELAVAQPHLVLINCGRAAVINKAALSHALRAQQIAFYGADVFWREPMPLWDQFRVMRNVCITPHLSESVTDRIPHDRHIAEALDQLVRTIDAS
ncbi:MAG: NAD(P)-dependent oxidoreductase [Acidobacteriota bacterium]|nr:NAD(P)-dependent oxidoreductase [Acidobacteriota bacterium]